MAGESTPTTVEELQTAIDLVNDTQQPEPWALPCYWPRTPSAGILAVMATLDPDAREVTIYFDSPLEDNVPSVDNFNLIVSADDGATNFIGTDLTFVGIDENMLTLGYTTGDPADVSWRAEYSGTGSTTIKGADGSPINPFVVVPQTAV